MKTLFALALLVSASASAASVGTSVTKVATIHTYANFGGGDVAFTVENPIAGCDHGFFMSKTDPGFAANFASLLSALHGKSSVVIYAHPDQLWGGSGGKYCRLNNVELRAS